MRTQALARKRCGPCANVECECRALRAGCKRQLLLPMQRGWSLPLMVTVSRAGHLKQSLGPTMVVAARLEPLAVPISLRAEENQVLADGQADRQEAEGRE